MRFNPNTDVATISQAGTALANTEVVITLPADPEQSFVIDHIYFSYSGAAAVGTLKIAVSGATLFQLTEDVARGIGNHVDFSPRGFPPFPKDTAATVTLSAGGADAIGKLNVLYR